MDCVNHGGRTTQGRENVCDQCEIESLRAEVERLRAALAKYGLHLGCSAWQGKHNEAEICTCGYSAAMLNAGTTPAQDTAETVATEWES